MTGQPQEPEFGAAQRARVILQFTERDQQVHCSENGWARVDGPWLHWFCDENDGRWQSWPAHNVVCIEWEPVL